MMNTCKRLTQLLVLIAIISGCSSGPVDSGESTLQSVQETAITERGDRYELRDVPMLEVDLPPEPRPWDTDVKVLQDSIAAHDGQAKIGFKASDSQRLFESDGIRAAISAEEFRLGLEEMREMGVTIQTVYTSIGAAFVKMDPELVPELVDHPRVDYIEIPIKYQSFSNASTISAIQGQSIHWGLNMVRAPLAWQHATGDGVKLLILDSGISNHEDLPTIPSGNCDSNFDNNNCFSQNPHGTMVSGTIFAKDNNLGTVGISHGIDSADVYIFKYCNTPLCDFQSEVIDGIEFGILNNVDVINLSIGSPTHDTCLSNAISSAWNAGIVLVAAAGNNPRSNFSPGDVIYPAGFSQVIGVSGVDSNGYFVDSTPSGCSEYSNFGPHVSISSPFESYTTRPGYPAYQSLCGTSFSAPLVSGATALLIEQNPTWSNTQIRNRLLNTANHPFGSMTPDQEYGYGVLDAAAALGNTLSIYPSIDGPNQIQLNQYVEFEASAEGGLKPYSFEWQIDYTLTGNSWQTVGSSASFYGHLSYTLDDFLLRVIVTDANNDTGTSTFHHVTVTY